MNCIPETPDPLYQLQLNFGIPQTAIEKISSWPSGRKTLEDIAGYVMNGSEPNFKSRALLYNSLMDTYQRFTGEWGLVMFLLRILDRLPMECRGSMKAVDAWCARGGYNGRPGR